MPVYKTDEEIIVLYKNNEQEALKILIDRYASPLYNFVARLTKPKRCRRYSSGSFYKNLEKYSSVLIHKKQVLKLGFLLLPKTPQLIF
jgi:hypothetical protein